MKAHSLGRELIALGESLLAGPNIETRNLAITDVRELKQASGPSAEMAFGITTLAQLSRFSRSEWVSFVAEHQIPIVFNERDSGRNIMGKIMSYLADSDAEIERIRTSVAQPGSSNRLNQALNTLLKGSSS